MIAFSASLSLLANKHQESRGDSGGPVNRKRAIRDETSGEMRCCYDAWIPRLKRLLRTDRSRVMEKDQVALHKDRAIAITSAMRQTDS